MIGESTKPEFDRDGFVVVPQFLTGDELTELQRELDRYISQVVPTLPHADAFYHERTDARTLRQLQHMGKDPYFEACRRHPRWMELAELLVGEPVEGQEPEWFNKPPNLDHATPPHQDNYYFCLNPPNVVTLWLALDDVDEENGCLRYVAGSHRRGIRPHAQTQALGFSQGISDYGAGDREIERVACLQVGDLVAHHGNTIHRADPNRTKDRQRRAFAIVFRGVSCRRDESAYARYEEALRRQHESMGLKTGVIGGKANSQ
jgi:phytanoyl-CoA hydroxylase